MLQGNNNSKNQQKKLNIKLFIVLVIIGVIIIVIGISMLSSEMSNQNENIKNPSDFDECYNLTIRKKGDTIIVKGILNVKENNPIGTGYLYGFEGSDNRFLSGENIGNKGDSIMVEIEIDDMNLPTAIRVLKENNYLLISIIFIIIGLILLSFGFMIKRRISRNILG